MSLAKKMPLRGLLSNEEYCGDLCTMSDLFTVVIYVMLYLFIASIVGSLLWILSGDFFAVVVGNLFIVIVTLLVLKATLEKSND